MTTNNAGHRLDSAGNVAVDYVWGNMAPQPDDDRADGTPTATVTVGGDQNVGWTQTSTIASARLDYTIGNHSIIEAGWNGYPAYTPNDPGAFVGGVAFVKVPSVIGLTVASAIDALKDAGYLAANITTAAAVTPAVSSVTLATNVATLLTSAAHGYAVGDVVVITGLVDVATDLYSELNGTHTLITGTTASTLTFALTHADLPVNTTTALSSATAKVAAKAGLVKTQSVAAGAASIALGTTITIAPYFAS